MHDDCDPLEYLVGLTYEEMADEFRRELRDVVGVPAVPSADAGRAAHFGFVGAVADLLGMVVEIHYVAPNYDQDARGKPTIFTAPEQWSVPAWDECSEEPQHEGVGDNASEAMMMTVICKRRGVQSV